MAQNRHIALWGYEDWLYDDGSILIKYICANKHLSIQVHPNDDVAQITGGKAKTEMWHILKSGPIFAGFKRDVTKQDIEKAIKHGSLEQLLVKIDTHVGECYLIPGGLVHAIGEGTQVLEVQQSSNTTFRLYDWNRVDENGISRQLHIKEALMALNICLPPPNPCDAIICKYFEFKATHIDNAVLTDRYQIIYDNVNMLIKIVTPSKNVFTIPFNPSI